MATKNEKQVMNVSVVSNESAKAAKVEPAKVTNKSAESASAELMKVSDAKRVVKTAFENEFLTPFKCLHWSNKHKNESAFSDLYRRYNITDDKGKVRNLEFKDLLNILPDGCTDDKERVFCKLSASDKDGHAASTFVDKAEKVWYLIPIKYSTNDFFASVAARVSLTKKETALKVWNDDADARKKAEKAKREKLSAKIKDLRDNDAYKSLDDAQIELIAREITGVRLPLN